MVEAVRQANKAQNKTATQADPSKRFKKSILISGATLWSVTCLVDESVYFLVALNNAGNEEEKKVSNFAKVANHLIKCSLERERALLFLYKRLIGNILASCCRAIDSNQVNLQKQISKWTNHADRSSQ